MPVYTFQLAAQLAGRAVSVIAAGGADVVTSGVLDGDAKFVATLPVGDYIATAGTGYYKHSSAGTVDLGDRDGLLTEAVADSTYAAKWRPSTAYAAGQAVVNPSGDIVVAKAAFTSGATYSPTNWQLPPLTLGVSNQADSAKSMAVRGFAPKTNPLAKMWAFPGAAGHGFVSAGSAGATFNLDDTSDFRLGDRSVSMKAPDTNGTYARMAKTGLTVDATGQYVRTWVKIDDIAKIANAGNSLQILLGDSSLANYYTADVIKPAIYGTSLEAKSPIKSGEWTAIDIPWSAFTVGAGTPSRSTIGAAALLVYGNAAGSAKVWWNGVGGVTERTTYPNGVISLTFDDTYAEAYTVARPYMDKYGYAGTLYPIQGNFGGAGFLTESQASEMYRVNGWDFGYHATTQAAHDADFTTYTEAQLVSEFEAQRAWASQRGIGGDSFAWPLARYGSLSESVASRYFQTARLNGASEVEVLPPWRPLRVRPILANSGATLASLQALVDKVKAGKGWGVVTFHRIVPSAPGGNDTTTAIFQGLVDYINTQGVPVQTVNQVMSRL